MKRKKIAVIGAGSWGTALAILLSRMGYHVFLWCHNSQKAILMARERKTSYLPGVVLSKNIKITNCLKSAVGDAEIIFSVVPSKYLRDITGLYSLCVVNNPIIISCAKGIESETFLRMSQIISEIIPDAKVFALSGPTFAIEVAQGKPTSAVIAGEKKHEDDLKRLQKLFSSEQLRLYRSTDMRGVEFGGALKNIIAIAAGISDGLGFGDNARAALIARGLSEIVRLAVAYGAKTKTLYGIAGVGDLSLTSNSNKSRNYGLGSQIGAGKELDKIMPEMTMVVEGLEVVKTVLQMAKKKGIEMPITEKLETILFKKQNPLEAVTELMMRDLKED